MAVDDRNSDSPLAETPSNEPKDGAFEGPTNRGDQLNGQPAPPPYEGSAPKEYEDVLNSDVSRLNVSSLDREH